MAEGPLGNLRNRFHGTTAEAGKGLIAGEPFQESDDDDWFGKGIYFWEYALQQAWWWARRFKKHIALARKIVTYQAAAPARALAGAAAWYEFLSCRGNKNPAVVVAILRLGNCLDLLDPVNVKDLQEFHDETLASFAAAGTEAPMNIRHHRNRDCLVFNQFYRRAEQKGKPIDSARVVYVPTDFKKRAWPGSWIYEEAHIQICVRNANNLLAVWDVRPDGRYGKQPEAPAPG